MLLEDIIPNREKLLRTAGEEVGYDLPLPKLKWPDAVLDEAIRLVNEFPTAVSAYSTQLNMLGSGHKVWPTGKHKPSEFWKSGVRKTLELYDFQLLEPIKDRWQAASYAGITPGIDIRRMAMDLRHAIDYILLLKTVLRHTEHHDDYKQAVAKATLKKLGVDL